MNGRVFSIITDSSSGATVMECFSRCGLVVPMRIAEHVERDTVVDVLLDANTIGSLLHFAVATVAAFDSVGSRRKLLVVEEDQSFVQIGRLKLVQDLAHLLEAAEERCDVLVIWIMVQSLGTIADACLLRPRGDGPARLASLPPGRSGRPRDRDGHRTLANRTRRTRRPGDGEIDRNIYRLDALADEDIAAVEAAS